MLCLPSLGSCNQVPGRLAEITISPTKPAGGDLSPSLSIDTEKSPQRLQTATTHPISTANG